jgi:hypothetical protein
MARPWWTAGSWGWARGLANRLKGRDLKDYAALRRDPDLRRLVNQKIDTPEGDLGSFLVYDHKGEIFLHPCQDIEGKNARTGSPTIRNCMTCCSVPSRLMRSMAITRISTAARTKSAGAIPAGSTSPARSLF